MKRGLIGWILCLSFIISCRDVGFHHQPQGIIEYEVTYLSNKSSMPTNLLPRKITLKFKGNRSITTIEGFMGMFALSNISDLRKNRNITLLKVMDKKLYYTGERNEFPFFFDQMTNIHIQPVNDSMRIAGFNCKKAIVTFNDTTYDSFDLYYTNDLLVEEPNRLTPFKEIDGILLSFNILLPNVEMRVVATRYKSVEINSNIFEIPDDYKKVTRRQMVNILNKLLE